MAVEYLPKLGLALVVLLVGFWVIKKIRRILQLSFDRAGLSKDITPFLSSVIDIGLKVLLIFSVAEIVGIETASFIAVLAAAGFAVGLALQGNLGNFASGVIILVFKPYKVGDIVEINGKFGEVEEIQIFNTIMESPGKKTLIIPNRRITDEVITNYTQKGVLRLELEILIAYINKFDKVKEILTEVVENNAFVLDDYETYIGIKEFDSHYIHVLVMPYIKPSDFWEARFSVMGEIKSSFAKHGIKLGYPEGVEFGDFETV